MNDETNAIAVLERHDIATIRLDYPMDEIDVTVIMDDGTSVGPLRMLVEDYALNSALHRLRTAGYTFLSIPRTDFSYVATIEITR